MDVDDAVNRARRTTSKTRSRSEAAPTRSGRERLHKLRLCGRDGTRLGISMGITWACGNRTDSHTDSVRVPSEFGPGAACLGPADRVPKRGFGRGVFDCAQSVADFPA